MVEFFGQDIDKPGKEKATLWSGRFWGITFSINSLPMKKRKIWTGGKEGRGSVGIKRIFQGRQV
jgi:hypothetical protein